MLRCNRICSIEHINSLLSHSLLSDMPSATNTDHDGRYYTETEIDTMLGDGTINHGNLSGLAGQGAGGGANDHGLGSDDSPTFAGLTIGTLSGILKGTTGVVSAITDNSTNWDLAVAHISESGASHTYINQNVTNVGTPTFAQITVDNLRLDGNALITTAGDLAIGSATNVTNLIGTLNVSTQLGTPAIVGAGNLSITATGGLVEFDDENLVTNGIIECDKLTLTAPSQDYLFDGRANLLVVQGQDNTKGAGVEIFSKAGSGAHSNYWNIWGKGLPGATTNREILQIGYVQTYCIINTQAAGTGTVRPLVIQTGANTNQIYLKTDGNVGIGENAPQDKLEVNGTILVKDALKFTQDDGNEYIDSLNDGYMDYGATIAHRFNNDVVLPKTSGKGVKIDTTTPTFGWRDLLGEITVKTVGANDPDYNDYAGTGIYRYQFKNTAVTEIFDDFHFPHDYVPGTEVYIHIHWSQTTVDTGGAAGVPGVVKWYFDANYSKGHDRGAFPAGVTTVSVTQTASGTIRQQLIAEVQLTTNGQIGGQDLEPDGVATVRTYRDAADAADTLDERPWVHHVDLHYQSTNMATKQKTPDFYT